MFSARVTGDNSGERGDCDHHHIHVGSLHQRTNKGNQNIWMDIEQIDQLRGAAKKLRARPLKKK